MDTDRKGAVSELKYGNAGSKRGLCAARAEFAASCQLWMTSDKRSCGDRQQRDMRNGVEICGGLLASDPQSLLCGSLEPGVVPLALCSHRIDGFECKGVTLDGKSVIIRQRHIFGTASGLGALVETFVVTGTVMQMGCSLVRTAVFLPRSPAI